MTLDPRLQRAIADNLPIAESIAWEFAKRVPAGELEEFRAITAEALVRSAHAWIGYCSARNFDPWDADDPSRPEKHFSGYLYKRARGALLDWCRAQDYLTRTARRRVRDVQAAQMAGARTDAELAALSGLTAAGVRAAQADALRPVSLDAYVAGTEYAEIPVPDACAGVEELAGVRAALDAMLAVFDALPGAQQVLVALTFYKELPLADAARAARLETAEAGRLLDAALSRIHQVLLAQVQAEGTGPSSPDCRAGA